MLCSIDGCDRPIRARGWCTTHWARWRRTGSPHVVRPRPAGAANPSWRGDDVGYQGVHIRLRKECGPATDHQCRCGKPAQQWAYTHDAPDERVDPRIGRPYSVDLSDYVPLCLSCHWRLDRPDYAGVG